MATKCVTLGFPGTTQPTVDVYCICGVCSIQLPRVSHWIPINWDVVVSWPVLGLGSLRTFCTRKERRHKKKQSESSQSSCSSSTDNDTHDCKPSKAAPHSPPVPKPNPSRLLFLAH